MLILIPIRLRVRILLQVTTVTSLNSRHLNENWAKTVAARDKTLTKFEEIKHVNLTRQVSSHKCKGADIILTEEEDKRYGQSYFSLQCSKCKTKTGLQTSNSQSSPWQPSSSIDINRRLVYAAFETGIGKEELGTICDILNMPQPRSNQAWNGHVNHCMRHTSLLLRNTSAKTEMSCTNNWWKINLKSLAERNQSMLL